MTQTNEEKELLKLGYKLKDMQTRDMGIPEKIVSADAQSFIRTLLSLKMLGDGIDVDKPFRIVADYDPEQQRMMFRYYVKEDV